jgi:hypothetical protein
LIRCALCFATIAVSFVLCAGSAGAQPGSAIGTSGAVPAGDPPVPAPAGMIASPAVERAIALGRKKKNANHALVLRDAGQGFANALAVLATPRWQAPATKSALHGEGQAFQAAADVAAFSVAARPPRARRRGEHERHA